MGPRQAANDADAVGLAVTLARRVGAPGGDIPVSPPPALIDSIRIALGAVSGFSHPAKDSIEGYGIHPRIEDPYSVLVRLDSLAPWGDVWAGGGSTTGVAQLDSVLQRLRPLPPREERGFGEGRYFVLRFEVPVRWWVLRDRLLGDRFVQDVGPWSTPVGDGNRLTTEREAGRWRFVYSVGWGDCPAGCTHRHEWTFDVSDDLRVIFVGSRGDPLPPNPRIPGEIVGSSVRTLRSDPVMCCSRAWVARTLEGTS